jgi:hypothetical protein
MLEENSLSATDAGFSIDFRSHWYRSLPLSSIGVLRVAIDGQPIPPDITQMEINGNTWSLEQLAQLYDHWWFILDPARLHVKGGPALRAGERHEVSLELGLLLPYILVGPKQEPLLSLSQLTKTLVCQ